MKVVMQACLQSRNFLFDMIDATILVNLEMEKLEVAFVTNYRKKGVVACHNLAAPQAMGGLFMLRKAYALLFFKIR